MTRDYLSKTFIALIFLSIWLIIPATILGQETQDKNYIIGPGDILEINVWDHLDLHRTVEISQEGSFTYPFIGQVKAANQSIFALERLITQKLADGYIVNPQVSISVTQYKNQKVFLFGEVNRPGSYVVKGKINLMELISEAGGFTEDRGTTCLIVRPHNSAAQDQPLPPEKTAKNELIELDLDQILSGNSENTDISIAPGDSVYIRKASNFFVIGEVVSPGRLKWEKNLTVRQAISIAGGGTPRAALNRIHIVRNKGGKELEFKPELGEFVMPNDVIKVPESWF